MSGRVQDGHVTGHVFVVHGRIEGIVHDVAIVPTAGDFHVRRYWNPVLRTDPELLRPPGWPGEGFARARGRDDVWFVNVGARAGEGPGILAERAVGALRDIAANRPEPARNRVKPLVALPILGIAGGGLDQQKGVVVRTLPEALTDAAAELDLDVALVTPDASVYGAAQFLRKQSAQWPLPPGQMSEVARLAESARKGDLALFMGAGVSVPAGLPTWSGLLEELATRHRIDAGIGFGRLNALDQAQFLHQRIDNLGEEVARSVGGAVVPALGHALLSTLGCAEAVTTNYDRLYERAVQMQRGGENVATVLPWGQPRSGRPWVLKLHGDLEAPDTIVLTRQQFISFDAETRPAGALLQALLMTRHVLFVGASLADDNVVRLAYEVNKYRRNHGLTDGVGTVLDVDDDQVRRELWQGKLSWSTMSGETIEERSRTLEIFLDAVAAHASSDESWLLDERFRGLLGLDDRLVGSARDLYRRVSQAGPEWEGLAGALLAFGASSGEYDEKLEARRWTAELPH